MGRPKYVKTMAVVLRRKGYSYSLINKKTSVPKGTLSGWLKDIKYIPNSIVLRRIRDAQSKSRKVLRKNKIDRIRSIKKIASRELGKISKRDLLMLGIGLYMGEGSKHKNGIVRVVNSDPKVIKVVKKWFIRCCGLSDNNFTLALHLYPDNDIDESIKFWSGVAGIPKSQFRKTQIDRRKNKKRNNKNRLPYGTAHLTIRAVGNEKKGVYLFRRILAWIDEAERQINAGIV